MAIAPPETRELAYSVWCECGQNLSECYRKMNGEHGYVISRQSLHEWKTKYDWEGRAARVDAEKIMMADATSDDALLVPLLKQKTKYENYFDGLPVGKIDTQAVYAYNSILKTMLIIKEKLSDGQINIDRPALFLNDMEFVAKTLREIDPEGLKVFARNFDVLVAKFKEQNAQEA